MGLGHRTLARLKMKPEEVNNFTPPKGLMINWVDYDYYQGEVTADITGMEWCPNDVEFVYKEEVNHLLTKLKVAQDGIRSSKYPIPFIRTVNTCKYLVEDTPYDYLISKSNENTEIIDSERLKSLSKNTITRLDKFYDNNNRKRYKLPTIGFTI